MKEEQIFHQVLEQPLEYRVAFLEAACGADIALRQQIAALLNAQENPGGFLQHPLCGVADLPTLAEPILERIGSQIGPYKLLEEIGQGGMGTVYMAEQKTPVRRCVALKIVKAGMDSRQVLARFDAERQALALMDHPGIARILDAGTTELGRPYFVMELVRGVPINEFCDQNRFTVRQRLELFQKVCQAVQHAHQKGIIHRDLKPTNVLVTKLDVVAVPKVIDFGIAKAFGAQLTDHTQVTGFAQFLGTPQYMSPEQAEMNQLGIDTRSDVYSLGVMLYELLTGGTPFDKHTLKTSNFDELRRILREEEPPNPSSRISTLNAEAQSTVSERRSSDPRRMVNIVRGELDWIVMKALEKDRERRYQTVNGFAEDIRRYLDNETVVACPPSVVYKLSKFSRRNTTALLTTAIVALALLIGTLLAGWQAIDARAARRLADENLVLARQRLAGEKQARAEVEAERTRTEANFVKAREAVQRMLARVADDQVSKIPQMQEMRRGLLGDAVSLYSELIELNPHDAQSYLERGAVLYSLAQYDKARDDYEQAVRLEPDNPNCHHELAFFFLFCLDVVYRDSDRSLFHAKRAVELDPRKIRFRSTLAFAYQRKGRIQDAVAEFKKAAELSPGSAYAENQLAKAFMFAGKPDLALPHQLKACELSPEVGYYYDGLAGIYDSLGQDDKALDALNKVFELSRNPMSVGSFYQYTLRGDIYARQKRYELARAEYDEALELAPFRSFTYKRRAKMHFQLQDYNAALADLNKSLELAPGDLSAVGWIPASQVAKCPSPEFRHGMKRLADRAIELNDGSAAAISTRAELLKGLGDFRQASADFSKTLELAPDNQTVLNRVAWHFATCIDANLRDAPKALHLATKAVELNPLDGAALNTLGVAKYRNGNWQGSMEDLKKSMELRSEGDSFDWFFLAMAYWQLDQKDEAHTWIDKAIEWMDKNQPENEELIRFRAEAEKLIQD